MLGESTAHRNAEGGARHTCGGGGGSPLPRVVLCESAPTVGFARVGSTLSARLSSSRGVLPSSMAFLIQCNVFLYRTGVGNVGQAPGIFVFEVASLVRY